MALPKSNKLSKGGPGGGYGSRQHVTTKVRTGAPRQHIQKAGVAQLGSMVGDHATDKGATGYKGVGLIGPKHPISAPLGNEVAQATVCGPGGSRTIHAHGSQQSGRVQPLQSTKDTLAEFGPGRK